MGIEEPKPEKKPEPDTSDMARNDVFAMAEGLTGSNSAILGNAYDHNASFTNQGEIEIPAPPVQTVAETTPVAETETSVISPENLPDPDAPEMAMIRMDAPPCDLGNGIKNAPRRSSGRGYRAVPPDRTSVV